MGIIIRQSIISSFYTYIGTIIGAFSILFAFPLFLSPEELGAFRLIIELGALLSGFGLLGIGQTIIRFYPFFREDNKSNGFLYLVLLLTVLGLVLVSILYFFFEEKLFDWFSRDKQYFSYIFIPIFLVAIFRIYQTVFENIAANHGKITTTNFFREILTRAGLLLLVFLYYKQWFTFIDFCIYVSLVFALNTILNYVFVIRPMKLDFKPNWAFINSKPELKKDMMNFNVWLVLSSLSLLIINKIDFFMIGSSKGMVDTAVYSIGFYLAVLIEIPKRSMQQVSGPIISTHLKNEDYGSLQKLYKQSANNAFFSAVVVFLFIVALMPLFFHLMPKGEIYGECLFVVYLIGTAKLVESWGVGAITIISNSPYYFFGLLSAIINIILAIYLNYVLIPVYGINGAAFATMVTIFVSISIAVIIVRWKFKLSPIDLRQLISLGLLLVSLIFFWNLNGFISNLWVESVLKVVWLLMLTFICIRFLKVSEELSSLLNKTLKYIR